MWIMEHKPKGLNTLDSCFYRGPHLFVALYRSYKALFWEVGICTRQYTPVYPKGFLDNFLNLPLHLQYKILEKVWVDGEGFNENVIHKGYPKLRVDTRFLFLIYGYHRTKTFLVNKLGYSCWNGGQCTSIEAHFHHGPFDSCASLTIPDYMDSSSQHVNFVDFTKLCFNIRNLFTRKNG